MAIFHRGVEDFLEESAGARRLSGCLFGLAFHVRLTDVVGQLDHWSHHSSVISSSHELSEQLAKQLERKSKSTNKSKSNSQSKACKAAA